MAHFLKLFLAALVPVAAVGAAVGVFVGWDHAAAGFPLLLLDAVRRSLEWTLVGTAVFLALYTAGRRLAARWLREAWVVPAATGVAAAPFVAVAGYHLNRARAIRPAEIFEPYALGPNLLLVAGCGVVGVALCFLLRRGERATAAPRPWTAVVAALVVLALHAGLAVALRSEHKEHPDVLILLVDALRAENVGCYGYGRDTTPAIDALARDSVVFRQAISQSTFTKTSIASLFTGRNPYRHGVYWGSRRSADGALTADLLGDEQTTLAEVLAADGYLTGAWVQNSQLRGDMGFAQGFVEYHDQQGSIARIHRRFRRWLGRGGRRYSYFAYLHYIDLHDPYRPPPPYDTLFGSFSDVYAGVDFGAWGSYLEAVREGKKTLSADDVEQLRAYYDGQLRAIDDEIGALLAALREAGLYERSLIVVSADHGDGFMEHGFISHSTTPYDELVRVPLIVKLPAGRFAGRVVERQVRLIDVMPTLLEALGVAARPEVDGCSLLPWIGGGSRPPEADSHCAYAVTEIAKENADPTLAVRTERFKYIHQADAPDELYDLRADPGEKHNLAAALGEGEGEGRPLRELALELVARRDRRGVDRIELDEQMIRELKALGYVGDG